MDDFFSGVWDNTKSSIDGVVNYEVNQFADNTIDTGLGFVESGANVVGDSINSFATAIGGEQFGGIVSDFTGGVIQGGMDYLSDAIYSSDFMHKVRTFSLFGSSSSTGMSIFGWSGDSPDWRVRLSLPSVSGFQSSQVLAPLTETDNSMIWPYTPNIIVTNNANYNSLSPTHNNYTYPAYENSSIEQITITGEFSVETPEDALYWVAVNHYLRSITKMFYGNSSNLGAPPPVVRLNGYGDFVFNNVPVVVESFMINLPKDVDYIKAPIGQNGSWVPVLSEISVTVRVAYSRDNVNSFSLDSFVNGDYLSGQPTGFI